jgi:hypothetical protein
MSSESVINLEAQQVVALAPPPASAFFSLFPITVVLNVVMIFEEEVGGADSETHEMDMKFVR